MIDEDWVQFCLVSEFGTGESRLLEVQLIVLEEKRQTGDWEGKELLGRS